MKESIEQLIKDHLKWGAISIDEIKINNLIFENGYFFSVNNVNIEIKFSQAYISIRFLLKILEHSICSEGFVKLSYKNDSSDYEVLHTVLLCRGNGKKVLRNIRFPFPVTNIRVDFIGFTEKFSIKAFCINSYSKFLYKFHNITDLTRVLIKPQILRLAFECVKNKQLSELKEKLYTEKENSKLKKLGLYKIPQAIYQEPIFTIEIQDKIKNLTKKPFFSVVMPVYNTPEKYLIKAINSVKCQWYSNWELCIVDDASHSKETLKVLNNLISDKNSVYASKIKIKFLDNNVNISKASNIALDMASGDFIVLMDHDDELTVDALYEASLALNECDYDFIYSDEDKLDLNGNYVEDHFKPDFSPDMLLSHNYISHLGIIRTDLVKKVGGWTEGLEGAQDYDLYLKVFEHIEKIKHIQKILYHWRKIPGSTAERFDEKSYAEDAGKRALEAAVSRRNLDADVIGGKTPGTYKVNYKIMGSPLISIIIPFRDQYDFLEKCINSIIKKSTYSNFEIIGLNNKSEEKATFDLMAKFEELDKRIKFFDYNKEFNYAAINNYAVEFLAKGEHIVLMNNDIEIITPNWLEELLMYSQRNNTGAVGAKLYFSDNTVQHGGVILGLGRYASHAHRFFPRDALGYANRLVTVHNLSAVTAALLMVKRKTYLSIGGFNEVKFPIAYNDVDFCLRLLKTGYLNVFNPFCEAYHYESISRGEDSKDIEKIKRFEKEKANLLAEHGEFIEKGDPYYNPNLTLAKEDFSLK